MNDYDIAVLGTGAAGLTAAILAHDGGGLGVFKKAPPWGHQRLARARSGPGMVFGFRAGVAAAAQVAVSARVA